MLDAGALEVAGPPDHPVDGVILFQKQLGQIGAILAGDAGDQCCFWRRCHFEQLNVDRSVSDIQLVRSG